MAPRAHASTTAPSPDRPSTGATAAGSDGQPGRARAVLVPRSDRCRGLLPSRAPGRPPARARLPGGGAGHRSAGGDAARPLLGAPADAAQATPRGTRRRRPGGGARSARRAAARCSSSARSTDPRWRPARRPPWRSAGPWPDGCRSGRRGWGRIADPVPFLTELAGRRHQGGGVRGRDLTRGLDRTV